MEEHKSIDNLFKDRIFRIPDYQRGYAWQHCHLAAFWEDLINLPENTFHYTGVLTLKEISTENIDHYYFCLRYDLTILHSW